MANISQHFIKVNFQLTSFILWLTIQYISLEINELFESDSVLLKDWWQVQDKYSRFKQFSADKWSDGIIDE